MTLNIHTDIQTDIPHVYNDPNLIVRMSYPQKKVLSAVLSWVSFSVPLSSFPPPHLMMSYVHTYISVKHRIDRCVEMNAKEHVHMITIQLRMSFSYQRLRSFSFIGWFFRVVYSSIRIIAIFIAIITFIRMKTRIVEVKSVDIYVSM